MKTAELSGALLDFWVAKAAGMEPSLISDSCVVLDMEHPDYVSRDVIPIGVFEPSTEWSQGGRIFERHARNVLSCAPYTEHWPEGPELLKMLMRAFVASKFGDEVSA